MKVDQMSYVPSVIEAGRLSEGAESFGYDGFWTRLGALSNREHSGANRLVQRTVQRTPCPPKLRFATQIHGSGRLPRSSLCHGCAADVMLAGDVPGKSLT